MARRVYWLLALLLVLPARGEHSGGYEAADRAHVPLRTQDAVSALYRRIVGALDSGMFVDCSNDAARTAKVNQIVREELAKLPPISNEQRADQQTTAARLVRLLNSPSYTVREDASEKLCAMGGQLLTLDVAAFWAIVNEVPQAEGRNRLGRALGCARAKFLPYLINPRLAVTQFLREHQPLIKATRGLWRALRPGLPQFEKIHRYYELTALLDAKPGARQDPRYRQQVQEQEALHDELGEWRAGMGNVDESLTQSVVGIFQEYFKPRAEKAPEIHASHIYFNAFQIGSFDLARMMIGNGERLPLPRERVLVCSPDENPSSARPLALEAAVETVVTFDGLYVDGLLQGQP